MGEPIYDCTGWTITEIPSLPKYTIKKCPYCGGTNIGTLIADDGDPTTFLDSIVYFCRDCMKAWDTSHEEKMRWTKR